MFSNTDATNKIEEYLKKGAINGGPWGNVSKFIDKS